MTGPNSVGVRVVIGELSEVRSAELAADGVGA